MLKNLLKTLRQKKVILAIFLVILIAAVALFLFPQKNRKIQLAVFADGAKFKVDFIFPDKTRDDIEQFLSSMNVSGNFLNGIEFELESTASAALAFALPIEADIEIKEKTINFVGRHNYPSPKLINPQIVKIPASTNLAIFIPTLSQFTKSYFNLPAEFAKWLDENLTSKKGYYVSIFGQEPSLLIIFSPEKLETVSLENLKLGDSEMAFYKKERFANDTDVHFVKLSEDEDLSAVIFEKDSWAYLIVSGESPQDVIDIYLKNGSDYLEFPTSTDWRATFVLWFLNNGSHTAEGKFYRLLFGQDLENTEAFEKIDQVQFSLLGTSFSGLIKFK